MPPLYGHDPFLHVQRLLCAPWLDGPMAVATVACEGWAMTLVALAFVLRRERTLRATARASAPVLAGMILAGLSVQLLKHVFDLPRPLAVYGPAAVHVVLEPLRLHSFPSGHSATAAALAFAGLRRYGRAAWPLALLALLGGLSRVYVGAHWTLDVLAGWAVGLTAAWAVSEAWVRVAWRLPRLRGSRPTLPAQDSAVAE